MRPVRRALVSVWDKTGVAELARGLADLGVEILSTGGTARHLRDAGVPVTSVSEVTGFPEILGGRVKTLHPHIHGGILADRGAPDHLEELVRHGIEPIDLVAVNLYPFRDAAARSGATAAEVVEMIDIGGPCMVRAAAKNAAGVVVMVDPGDYGEVLSALRGAEGMVPEALRRRLAAKAFRHTERYDAAIAAWLEAGEGAAASGLPHRLQLELERELEPRYGENPHQAAAVYRTRGGPGLLGGMEQQQGKTLSWNNLLDADAARRAVALFADPAVVIVKHNNPCGAARGTDLAAAYRRALATDPVSAFGSIIAVNRPLDGATAAAMAQLFVEVIVAPGFDAEAREALAAKANLRLLRCPPYRRRPDGIELRGIDGGFLAQAPDDGPDDAEGWRCVTKRAPTPGERRALEVAWATARAVKSNAIVLADGEGTVGIGAGQMSRVDACHLAVRKAALAGLATAATSAASDAFFPFRDGLDVLADAGVTAVVQPGGSKRDPEVIAAADERGVAMLFTGARHFRH